MWTQDVQEQLRAFAAERDWDQFHTPKNLAMAVAVEAGELLEAFQWLTPDQSKHLDPDTAGAVATELADVLIYLLRIADLLNIDLESAVLEKMRENAAKQPLQRRPRSSRYV